MADKASIIEPSPKTTADCGPNRATPVPIFKGDSIEAKYHSYRDGGDAEAIHAFH